MDTQITHYPDGELSTTVYRKATHTDKYLDFQSHHPLAHKAAVEWTLFFRADNICSSPLEKGTEEKHVTHALKSNGYPAKFIRSQSKPTRRPDTVNRSKATVVLPYVRHISETIRRILTALEIHTCFKPHQTLRQLLVHPKDPIPHAEARSRVPGTLCIMPRGAHWPNWTYLGTSSQETQEGTDFWHHHLLCSC